MKKRVDLFSQRVSSRAIMDYLGKARQYSLYFFVIQIVIIIALAGVYIFFSNTIQKRLNTKNTFKRFIALNTPFIQDLRRFAVKYAMLKTLLKDDARSFIYYKHLIAIFSRAPVKGELTQFQINSNHATEFTLGFDTYEQAISFIEYAESTTFLDNFVNLNVNQFDINDEKQYQKKDMFNLAFSGTFVELP